MIGSIPQRARASAQVHQLRDYDKSPPGQRVGVFCGGGLGYVTFFGGKIYALLVYSIIYNEMTGATGLDTISAGY